MEKTKEQARDEVIATFNAAIKEAQEANLGKYVVAVVSDATPFRETGDGKIAFYGPVIFNTDDEAQAARIAKGLNKQFKAKLINTRCDVELSSDWRQRRVNVILGFISQIVDAASSAE